MPSSTHKRKKNWDGKLRSRENKGTRKVNVFLQQWICVEGFQRARILVTIWKIQKRSCPLKLNNKENHLCDQLHEHTLFWLEIFSSECNLNPHAKLLNTGGFKINAFVSDTLMNSLFCIQFLELTHLGYARIKQIHWKLPMQSPNFYSKP